MTIVFGSEASRALLRGAGGFDFDLREVDPLDYRPMTAARHARLAEEVGQADEEVPSWCRVCQAHMRWIECSECSGFGSVGMDDRERECEACAGDGGRWRCDDVDYGDGRAKERT